MNEIGNRIKYIRNKVYNCTQIEFVQLLNNYLKENVVLKKFTQHNITSLETHNNLEHKKLILLINFLFETKKINANWLLIKNNKSLKLFAEKEENISINKNEIKEILKNIDKKVNNLCIRLNNNQ